MDPRPPSTIVVVEVPTARSAKYGAPEDKIDRSKVARLYRALAELRKTEGLVTDVTAYAVRVDLLVVDLRMGRGVQAPSRVGAAWSAAVTEQPVVDVVAAGKVVGARP